MCSKHVES